MAKGKPRQLPNESRRVVTSGDIEVSTYLEIAKEIGGEQPFDGATKMGKSKGGN